MNGQKWYNVFMNKLNTIVTSVMVTFGVGHDAVKVWSKGGLAGELLVTTGDGELMAKRLLGSPSAWVEAPQGTTSITWWCCPHCGVVGMGIENRQHHKC